MPPFADHFSRASGDYAAFRPTYPARLFEWLATIAPARRVAWDCATGSGQAALALSRWFSDVVASDASEAQLAQLPPQPGVHLLRMMAEAASIRSGTVDVVTVAQALHWFRHPRFYAEARRVLAPGGVLAAWRYGLASIGPDVDPILARLHGQTLAGHWPPERALVDAGYHTLDFPFEELDVPLFVMEARWTLAQLAGYLGTWSAVGRYRVATGRDPLPDVVAALAPDWGGTEATRLVRWPLEVRAGHVNELPNGGL